MTNGLFLSTVLSTVSLVRRFFSRYRAVFYNLVSLIVIQLTIAGIGFCTRIGVANTIGLEAFGNLAFAIALGTYGQTFIQFGMDKSLVRELIHFPTRFGEILKTSLVIRFALTGILAVVCGIFTLVPAASIEVITWEMVPAVCATLLGAFQLNGVYDAWKEMRRHALYAMIERFCYFGLIWLAITTSIWSLSLAQVGLIMLGTVSMGLWLQYRWALPRIKFTAVMGAWSTGIFLVQSNVSIWLATVASLSIEYLNQIILGCYTGKRELGEYSAAWVFVAAGLLVLTQVARIGSEAAARHTCGERPIIERCRFLTKYVALMAAVGLLVGLPCMCFAPQLLHLFRPEYAPAASTLRILGVLPVLYGPYLAALQYVISSRLHKTYLYLISLVGMVTVGLSLCLIPQMGSTGAAVSAVIAMAVAAGMFLTVAGLHLRKLNNIANRH